MAWNDGMTGLALGVAADTSRFIRVLAGPGTGKSYALRRRVARLLEEGAVAERILAVTFTRTAAKDLVSDLTGLGVAGCEEVVCGTLHGICFSVLNREQVLQVTGRYPRTMLKHEVRYLLLDLPADTFGSMNQRERRLREFEAAWARLQHEEAGWPIEEINRQFQVATLDWLRFHRAMVVAEMVTETLRYLRENPAAAERTLYQHVLVDEYQDLNKAEQTLIDMLAGNATLAVIGDDDQSIYGFKYAHPEGIIEFPTTHPETQPMALEECRRCPTLVVEMANELISHNQLRVEKRLLARHENVQGECHILQWQTLDEEAEGLARVVADKIHLHGVAAEQILFLVPRKLIAYKIRDALEAIGLHVQLNFEDETLDAVAAQEKFSLLNLIANPEDRVALRVLLGYGAQDGRSSAWNRLRQYCESNGQSPRQVLEKLITGELKLPYMQPLITRFQLIRDQVDQLSDLSPVDFIDAWIPNPVPALTTLRLWASEIAPTVDDLSQLYRELKSRISQPELPSATGMVRIMSLHKSKGLTAEMVVVAGCVEGLIPATVNDDAEGARKLEEFRRLFYVALTRTKNILFLSSVVGLPKTAALQMGAQFVGKGNRVRTRSSRFIAELGKTAPNSITGAEYLKNLG